MNGRKDRTTKPPSQNSAIIVGVVVGICVIGIACLVVVVVAGAGLSSLAGGGTGSGAGSAPVMIAGSRIEIGASAPEFTLQSVDGETHALNDYRGQIVFLNFWATWCPSCEGEMPAIESVYEAYQNEGFIVLAINAGESSRSIRGFQQEEELTFPLLIDPGESVTGSYGIFALPTSLLVDQEGVISRIYTGPITHGQLAEDIEGLFR
jgi:peroxiredoxin